MSDAPKVLAAPDDVLSTMKSDGSRRWIYPVTSPGKFFKRRRITGWALIALFVALPIVQIGGKPALLLDIIAQEFTFFGLTLYATDSLLFLLALLSVLVAVFLFTALFGRVWCGWACPQTVYLEFVFRPIEAFFEGKPSARRRRDEGEATPERLLRKGAKWLAFTIVAIGLAHTFVAYFVGWSRLIGWMNGSPSEHLMFFGVMSITTALVLFDFGFFREQMCTIACPYARFQSVLQDRDSLIVSYDPLRGEPRGRRSRAQRTQEAAGAKLALGDCIDCGACVRTCPTGIDIRDGLQMECVACTQCIDACDAIMIGVGKPVGLIRYSSENEIDRQPTRRVRPRTVIYGILFVGLVSVFATLVAAQKPFEVDTARAGNTMFATLPDGTISNRLRFRVQNRSRELSKYSIDATNPTNLQVRLVGRPQLEVAAGHTERVEAWVVVPPEDFTTGKLTATFRITDSEGRTEDVEFTLLGPSS